MNKEEKANLWSERIQEFQTSGQTCKQWCAEKVIHLSTMGYWTRRLAKKIPHPNLNRSWSLPDCPSCDSMKRLEKEPSLIRGSMATPSLVAGIMNAKYVNGMPLARQEREFARYDLDLSTKIMAN